MKDLTIFDLLEKWQHNEREYHNGFEFTFIIPSKPTWKETWVITQWCKKFEMEIIRLRYDHQGLCWLNNGCRVSFTLK